MSKRPRRTHPDHARRLPRYDPEYCAAEDDLFEDELTEVLEEPPDATDEASAGQLRGIPCIGRGVTGAIGDTHPEDCIDRIDHERGNAA